MHRWTTQLIPPELMGSHIASGRSHTTGRVTTSTSGRRPRSSATWASSGTWPVRPGGARRAAGWIPLFKEHRALLLSGDLVRVDFPDQSLIAGVVAADQSRACSASPRWVGPRSSRSAGCGSPDWTPRRYRVTPLMLESAPSGLRPPLWWGVEHEPVDKYAEFATGGRARYRMSGDGELGIELPGGVLMEVDSRQPRSTRSTRSCTTFSPWTSQVGRGRQISYGLVLSIPLDRQLRRALDERRHVAHPMGCHIGTVPVPPVVGPADESSATRA